MGKNERLEPGVIIETSGGYVKLLFKESFVTVIPESIRKDSDETESDYMVYYKERWLVEYPTWEEVIRVRGKVKQKYRLTHLTIAGRKTHKSFLREIGYWIEDKLYKINDNNDPNPEERGCD